VRYHTLYYSAQRILVICVFTVSRFARYLRVRFPTFPSSALYDNVGCVTQTDVCNRGVRSLRTRRGGRNQTVDQHPSHVFPDGFLTRSSSVLWWPRQHVEVSGNEVCEHVRPVHVGFTLQKSPNISIGCFFVWFTLVSCFGRMWCIVVDKLFPLPPIVTNFRYRKNWSVYESFRVYRGRILPKIFLLSSDFFNKRECKIA